MAFIVQLLLTIFGPDFLGDPFTLVALIACKLAEVF